MRVTQLDIAKIANVSQATVSRVLSGDERVEFEIRDRVLGVIKAHNYQPDVRAQALRLRRTGLIGLVLKRSQGGLGDDPFFASLTAGIMDYLCGRPYHLCIDVVTDHASQQWIYDEMLRTRRVDGLILVEPEARDERISRLQRDKFPFVIIGDPQNPRIASVDNDNIQAGEMATRHLLDQGYKRVGILGGPRHVTFSDARIEGYRRAVRAAGQEPVIWHSDFGFEPAEREAIRIFDGADRPDALVVLDDFMAFAVVTAARKRYLRVPEHLGVVGFNNSHLCQMLDAGLTSVDLEIDQMVVRACSKLLSIIEGEDGAAATREIVPAQLVVRGSSKRQEARV